MNEVYKVKIHLYASFDTCAHESPRIKCEKNVMSSCVKLQNVLFYNQLMSLSISNSPV